jgi:hypothetical protein
MTQSECTDDVPSHLLLRTLGCTCTTLLGLDGSFHYIRHWVLHSRTLLLHYLLQQLYVILTVLDALQGDLLEYHLVLSQCSCLICENV